ncbi:MULTISPECIES: hypothetical protein [unclassified Candidatus Frackibacter]|uniref:hypothetical protein n=1 Tax=unclassified Candidatus Frackibacter TaxID=2648818 RepID=UPI000890A09E|nr:MULTISPECIES: hypothetical protein [unclassified Candidatus Frackibacter]SDC38008.1 hypothetical protein SAMN04515661_10866 [Candidatus Frackibacter sp. WG11]SEM62195.1 hypothetical protein SAMN04488698_10923 [Candidatus Frackibacter sp. WG12]SFL65719.1 hypothetical protein SAMN04488699_10867 [Candidatus Frackibacter sp. WG13]
MDSKSKVIQDNTSLDEEEAKLALDLAEGDLEQALQMVEYVEKSFFTLQIKFQTESSNKMYGLVSIIADGKNGDLLKLGVACSYHRDDVGLGISNQAFNQTIEEIKSESNSSYDSNVQQAFHDNLNSADVFELFTKTKQEEIQETKFMVEDILNEIFDKRVEVMVESELMTKAQVQQLIEITYESDLEETVQDEETELSIYLKCTPIISAVKGIRAGDLEVGDKLLVRIVDRREVGRYLADLISTEDQQIAIGVIDQIYFNEDSKRYTLMIEFGPNIYGKLLIDSEVKLALAHELNKNNNNQEAKELSTTMVQLDISRSLLFLFSILIILIIILFYLI